MLQCLRIPLKAIVITTVMIALIAVGFAHRSAQPEMTPELAAFVAAGGSLDDLCGTINNDGAPALVDCEACRLADTLALSRACGLRLIVTTEQTLTFRVIARQIAHVRDLDPARLTRAPPQA